MGLLQTLGASINRVLPTGDGAVSRFQRLVRAAYAIFLVFLLTELAILAFGISLPNILRTVVHGIAALSIIIALVIGAAYYVTAGHIWPSAS